jgi:hypothetical protein
MRLPRVRFTVRRLMVAVAVIALLSGGEVARRRWVFCKQRAAGHRSLQNDLITMAVSRERSIQAARGSGRAGDTLPLLWKAMAANDRLRAGHHAAMAGEFQRAASRPWLGIPEERPEPPPIDAGLVMEQILRNQASSPEAGP